MSKNVEKENTKTKPIGLNRKKKNMNISKPGKEKRRASSLKRGWEKGNIRNDMPCREFKSIDRQKWMGGCPVGWPGQ
jgi:hypothetical protein